MTKYCKAGIFSEVGKETPLFSRLSGTFIEQGDAETTRDVRGWAIKFYTEEGVWDLLTVNMPVFGVRDAKVGPDAVHAFKRDCTALMWNQTGFWDFVSNHPEGLHQVAMLYTDMMGTPMSYRTQNWFGCNTYSLMNASNQRTWIRFHLINQQGEVKGFELQDAKIVAGEEPDWLTKDIRNAINKGMFPKWKLMVQVMPEDEGYQKDFAFDCTKIWDEKTYPLMEIGVIELNRLPVDYFSEVEQSAFAPSHIIPGIGFSPDKLLQGRVLLYDDTQRHRIGPNYKQLPINRPLNNCPVNSHHVGGPMNVTISDKFPNWAPSSLGNAYKPSTASKEPPLRCDGPADYYDYPGEGTDEDYYGQATKFYEHLKDEQKANLCYNMAHSLAKVEKKEIVDKIVASLRKCNSDWAHKVESGIKDMQGDKKPKGMQMCEKFQKELLSESHHSSHSHTVGN
jgi:catalase